MPAETDPLTLVVGIAGALGGLGAAWFGLRGKTGEITASSTKDLIQSLQAEIVRKTNELKTADAELDALQKERTAERRRHDEEIKAEIEARRAEREASREERHQILQQSHALALENELLRSSKEKGSVLVIPAHTLGEIVAPLQPINPPDDHTTP